MKRALAERAKQSGLPNGVTTPSVPSIQEKPVPLEAPRNSPSTISSVPTGNSYNDAIGTTSPPQIPAREVLPHAPLLLQQQNLTKMVIPKHELNTNAVSSNSETQSSSKPMRSPLPSPSPRPKKRLRESSVEKFKQLQEEDEDDSSASAFYLKHQNRALSSELRSVKYQLSRLERERDFRRTQCSEAVQSLNALRSVWGQLESSLGEGRGVSFTSDPPSNLTAETAPLSTGSGTSVEMIGAFINSLAQLGETPTSRLRGETEVDEEKKVVSKQEVESKQEKETLNDLSKITENIAERASLLQSWILSLLEKVEKAPLANGEIVLPPEAMELQDKITHVEAENASLQQRIEELARSRDEITESDRRVRRGLYRLAAGRVQLKEVLKAVASADEDKEAAAAWMETGSVAICGPSLTISASTASVPNNTNEKTISEDDKQATTGASSEEVAQLTKQVAELNEVAAARDEQIKQV